MPTQDPSKPARTRHRNRQAPPALTTGTFTRPELHDLDLTKLTPDSIPITSLRSPNRKLRTRDQERIQSLADRMREHRAPLVVFTFPDDELAWGDDIVEAYRLMGATTVPVFRLEDRGPGEKAAARLFLDRAFAEGVLDPDTVKIELETVCDLAPDWLASTHMTSVEIDFALHFNPDGDDGGGINPVQPVARDAQVVTQTGDLYRWTSGHRMSCGNARDPSVTVRLMNGASAHALTADPPYGTKVADISSSHQEWKEGSGMSDAETETFYGDYLAACLPVLRPRAPVYLFSDWKGLYPLLAATRAAGVVQKSLCTWDKQASAPRSGLYRSQSEHIYVGQYGKPAKGEKPPKRRRGRTTIWTAPGYGSFRPDRKQALADHACTKPQSILMDLLQDATQIGDICLDPFGGSGSMMVAAQRLKRICYSIEIEERSCDIAIRRMYEVTGEYPIEEGSGLSFEELAKVRGVPLPTTRRDGDA